jgi:hypothetical protein
VIGENGLLDFDVRIGWTLRDNLCGGVKEEKGEELKSLTTVMTICGSYVACVMYLYKCDCVSFHPSGVLSLATTRRPIAMPNTP